MSKDTQQLLAALTAATQSETDGYHFYMMAAKSTRDEQGRRAFEQLAALKAHHFDADGLPPA